MLGFFEGEKEKLEGVTNSSNSCPISTSFPNLYDWVSTECRPLLSTIWKAVLVSGTGTSMSVMPMTASRKEQSASAAALPCPLGPFSSTHS